MKVGITSNALSNQGGISRYVLELAERFSLEHEIHLLTSRIDHDIPGAIIHKSRILWRPPSLLVATSAYMNTKVGRMLKKKGIVQLIHGQGAEYLQPDVVTAHSCQKAAVEHLRSVRGGTYRLLKPFEPASNIVLAIEGRNYRKGGCKKIISVAEGVKWEIVKYYGVPEQDITVIPNGVDLKEFTPENRGIFRDKIRISHGIAGSDTLLAFSAWEFNRKGLRHIIEALPMTGKDVKLLAMGGDDQGPYRKLAQRLGVEDRIIFTGHTTKVREYLAASDIFVFPTAYEAFSLATLEAAASGLPLIATKVNGTDELIADGYNGFFVKQDGADIADKVNRIIASGPEKMGANARKTAENYSWDKAAEKTLKVYREAIE